MDNYLNFEMLDEELEDTAEGEISSRLQRNIIVHLTELQESFDSYFAGGDLKPSDAWIRDTVQFNIDKMLDEELTK